MKEEGEMLRDYMTQTHMVNEASMKETIADIKGLEKQFYDRDKPFFQVFGDELLKHKDMINGIVKRMKEETSQSQSFSYVKI